MLAWLTMTWIGAVVAVHVDRLEAQPDTSRIAAPDSARFGGGDTARTAMPGLPATPGGAGGPGGPPTPYVMPPLGQIVLADLHNKLIHFPIVLALVAAVMVVLSRRRPELEPVAFWLVWFATVFTLAAYFSGIVAAVEFEHRSKHWLADTHRNWAIAFAFAECIWLLALLRRRTRGFAFLWSFVVAALVLVAGGLGGLVAHGRGAAPPQAAPAATSRP